MRISGRTGTGVTMGREAKGHAIWRVHGKGKGAVIGDRAVRTAFRAAGWMDIKTSAVSDAFSATLYRPDKV